VHTNDALNLRCTKMPDWADRARWRGRILSQIRSPRRRGCPCRKKKPVGCRDGNRVILRLMLDFLRLLLGLMADLFRSRASLEAEELALRQRSTCCSARGRSDRHSRRWTGWCSVGFVGGSRTLATRSRSSDLRRSCGHRACFRAYWRWKSRRRPGRPAVSIEIRQLIREFSIANPLWGAPRLHGELLKLGIDIGQTSVAKYMVRRRGPSVRGLEDILAQPCGRDCCDRPVRGADGLVPAALRVVDRGS
jgi:hypothetical protein